MDAYIDGLLHQLAEYGYKGQIISIKHLSELEEEIKERFSKGSFDEEFYKLRDKFCDLDVYIYLKSQDQQWYQEKSEGTNSIHWTEFCQFPWSSMTIKSNCQAVECVEDYNNEIILGNTQTESLEEIWNGEPYRKFRETHFDLTRNIKCTERCDMKLIGTMCL